LEYVVRGEQRNLFELIHAIATTQGVKGFWKGNFVNILRTAPFKAVNFYAYDTESNFSNGLVMKKLRTLRDSSLVLQQQYCAYRWIQYAYLHILYSRFFIFLLNIALFEVLISD
jgi:hypothetical protein